MDTPATSSPSGRVATLPNTARRSLDEPASWAVSARAGVSAVDPEMAAYHAAVAAPLRVRPSDGGGTIPTDLALEIPSPLTAPPSEAAGTQAVAGTRSPTPDARWGRQQRFMQRVGADTTSRNVAQASLEPAPGPFALQAGTMIPAVLLTEINSDLPGDVLAQVAHDVYDSRDQTTLLIPKAARLIGTYDSDISSNQRRLFVAWTRLIYPDGRSVTLAGLETKDRSGAGGVADQVDQHRRRTFGVSALLSILSAGAQLAQPNGGYGVAGAYPSSGQIVAGAAGQQLSQVATEMLRKQMDVQPTIRIRQGMTFQVFLRSDLAFPDAYRPARAP